MLKPWLDLREASSDRRLAVIVAAGEIDGREFDWDALRWKDDTA